MVVEDAGDSPTPASDPIGKEAVPADPVPFSRAVDEDNVEESDISHHETKIQFRSFHIADYLKKTASVFPETRYELHSV